MRRSSAAATERVPADAVDGRVKLAPVGGELLQRSHSRAGADDPDEVSRLHLLVDEFLQRVLHVRGALERKAEIVHHEGDRAADVFAPQADRRRWSRGALCAARGRGRGWGRGGRRRDVGEIRDLLLAAVLVDLEILGVQVRHGTVARVGDDRVDLHQIDDDPDNGVLLRRALRRRLLRVPRGERGERERRRAEDRAGGSEHRVIVAP